MKKLILSGAIILGSLSTYASTVNNEAVKIETAMQDDSFTLIDSADLPAPIIQSLEDTFPGYVIVAAYINEYGEYQVDITVEESTGTFYLDVDGNFLKF
ncbi:hypothetical protein [Flavobacterium sp.]|uniref:hypothetical protein n=1 Tax=Flavobacterium sp. TaxID=239 RepID=UPI003264F364